MHDGGEHRKEVFGVRQDVQVVPDDAPPVQRQREGVGLRLLLLQPGVASGGAEVQADQHRDAVAESEIEADEDLWEEAFKGKCYTTVTLNCSNVLRSPKHTRFTSIYRALQ